MRYFELSTPVVTLKLARVTITFPRLVKGQELQDVVRGTIGPQFYVQKLMMNVGYLQYRRFDFAQIL